MPDSTNTNGIRGHEIATPEGVGAKPRSRGGEREGGTASGSSSNLRGREGGRGEREVFFFLNTIKDIFIFLEIF